MEKIRLGTNEDGSPHYLYRATEPNESLVITGPISGNVVLPDGTVYDVTPDVITVDPGHELLVSDAIGERHEAEGHPAFANSEHDFVHIPSSVSHKKKKG